MDAELKSVVVPKLRDRGFKGSFPHFRRLTEGGVDLLTFQFDRNGGGFVIEIARSPIAGVKTPWGKQIPANKVTAWDLDPKERRRLKPSVGSGTDSWFRYDAGECKEVAHQVLPKIDEAEAWWSAHV